MSTDTDRTSWCSASTPKLDPELLARLALRRVHEGGVTRVSGGWLDHGRRLPSYLPTTLDDLASNGRVVLTAPDPVAQATQRAALTDAGQLQYTQLRQRYDARPTPQPVRKILSPRILAP